MLKPLLYIVLFNFLTINVLCQDTLPNIKARIRSGKVIISWVNPFKDVALINIQRSSDSLKNFKTILTVTDPTAVTNGYLDSKAPDTRQFYRLFVQQSGGRYFFTQSYRPFLDTAKSKAKTAQTKQAPTKESAVVVTVVKDQAPADIPRDMAQTPVSDPLGPITDSTVSESSYRPERNDNQKIKFSNTKTIGKDSSKIGSSTPKEFRPPPVFVFSNTQGQVVIVLPEEKKSVYTLKFFTDAGEPVFTLNNIRESHLTIEKTNFHNAGWYRCELYEADKFREKYRVFISKD